MKKAIRFVFLSPLFFIFCIGCASKGTPLLQGTTLQGDPVCLANPDGIPEIVRKFFATRDLTTEEGKIDYLLERVQKSDLVFVRNRVEYDGPSAAQFLRWKMNRIAKRWGIKVKTAQDFVSQVASGSRMSGQSYSVILSDKTRHDLKNVLQNELDALEYCLKQYKTVADTTQSRGGSGNAPSSMLAQQQTNTAAVR